jgi:hypothetical protein
MYKIHERKKSMSTHMTEANENEEKRKISKMEIA